MSSKRKLRKNACTGKVVYKTRESANGAMTRLIRSGKATGFVNVYPCPFGSHFHVGRRPKHP